MSAPPQPPAADCRCACGSLLARLVGDGVELKCRRCKRTHFVPLEAADRGGVRTAPSTPAVRAGGRR